MIHATTTLTLTVLGMCHAFAADYAAYKSDPAKQKKEEADWIAWMVQERSDPNEVAKAGAWGVYLARASVEYTAVMLPHIVLGMATLPHAVRARYPEVTAKPEDLYTDTNPIIRRFDDPSRSPRCSLPA